MRILYNIDGVQKIEEKKFPHTMRVPVKFDYPGSSSGPSVRSLVEKSKVHTVCEESACPNMAHCWSSGTATFMIMGDLCTRKCKFCNIKTARPAPLDSEEPERLGQAIRDMKVKTAVITSVDRDDLSDCGSAHFAESILSVKKYAPQTRIEVLIPDFKGKIDNLRRIWDAAPDIINHNVETVPSLYRTICPQSRYELSLEVLRLSKEQGFLTKSGMILGLGETLREVHEVMMDLRKAGVDILTIGQYLPPSSQHAPLISWIEPEVFYELKSRGYSQGFRHIESGTLVRSSYHAGEGVIKLLEKNNS